MRELIMSGTYVVNSDKMEIGGVPILFFLLGVAVFFVIIAVVIICMCSGKKKSNGQGAPLQPTAVQPPCPLPPQPMQSVPPVQPVQPMQSVQPAPSAPGTYGYGISVDDDDRTQIITDDDSTQIITQEYMLNLSDKANPERTFRVPLRGTVIIGRRAGEANIVIDYDKSVSGRHCQVREADGRVFVEDMQSANGTLVDGMRILSETEIVSGSVLTLGRVELKVDICCE